MRRKIQLFFFKSNSAIAYSECVCSNARFLSSKTNSFPPLMWPVTCTMQLKNKTLKITRFIMQTLNLILCCSTFGTQSFWVGAGQRGTSLQNCQYVSIGSTRVSWQAAQSTSWKWGPSNEAVVFFCTGIMVVALGRTAWFTVSSSAHTTRMLTGRWAPHTVCSPYWSGCPSTVSLKWQVTPFLYWVFFPNHFLSWLSAAR